MAREPEFEVVTGSETTLSETLLIGVTDFGVAGLTAVDYLTSEHDMDQVGHVQSRNVPDITPFTDGKPRRPIRLYDDPDENVSVLLSEVFLPVWSAEYVAHALFEWLPSTAVSELAIPFGAPLPHTEEEHLVTGVGTDDFPDRRFADADVEPLTGGFFDGIVGELVSRGMNDDAVPVGVFVTPAHYPGPDFDAAIRLLDGLEPAYDITIDLTELRERSLEMKRHYQEIADRLQSLQQDEVPLQSRDFPEDRMFM